MEREQIHQGLVSAVTEGDGHFLQSSQVINLLSAAVYTCNAKGKITYFNEVAVQLWGYRPDTNDELLKYCACYKVFVNDQYVAPDQTPMAITLETGQSFRHVEALIQRPDGSTLYASVNIDPIRDKHNNVVGAINVFQDISHHKQTEMQLKTREWQYRQLVQNLDTPLYTTDMEGRITLYNQAAAALWGREPVIGQDLWCGSFKILKTDGTDLPLDSCPMAVCLKERRAVLHEEILVVRPDGTLRYVAPHPQPVFDDAGNMTGAINMLIDITDRKRSEIALRESDEKYRALADSLERQVAEKTNDLLEKAAELKKSEERHYKMIEEVEDYAIILLDSTGIIQNWNKGAQRIKGYTEEEIVGRSFQEFYLPEDRQRGLPLQLLQEAAEKDKALHEGWRRRKDGTKFWGSIVLTALHDAEKNIIGFSKVTRDLTQLKLAEDHMKEYLQQLEFQNKELEQFVYACSHDLKEPLRKIQVYNEFIFDNPSNQLDSRSQDYLGRSIRAAERMKNIIEDLLTYSRTTSGSEAFEKVDVKEIINQIAAFHQEELEQKIIRLEVANMPSIRAIPFQVKQLLFNLISNAVKYKHPGRDGLIKIQHSVVMGMNIKDKAADPQRQYDKIAVIDNGIGFNPQYARKIFEIFQRLDNSQGQKGAGVGLAICKKIVQNHKGFIEATAVPGEGASFFIYLPIL
jgi:PAS domain S-box-containing protein